MEVAEGEDRGRGARLHVGDAASVDLAVRDGAAPRILGPDCASSTGGGCSWRRVCPFSPRSELSGKRIHRRRLDRRKELPDHAGPHERSRARAGDATMKPPINWPSGVTSAVCITFDL